VFKKIKFCTKQIKEVFAMVFIVEEPAVIDDQRIHRAELVAIKPGTSDNYGAYLRFVFQLVEVSEYPFISGICPAQLIVGNKLYSWLSVLNGANLETGTPVDPQDYVGRTVELTVKNVADNGRNFTNVDNLVRLINSNDQDI
jgi:hypothetical protein